MKAELDCNIVRDMLPLYIEKLTSEESNIAIQQHLEQCKDCKEYFENIKKPIDHPTVPKKEIDYMKKVKRSFKRKNYILAAIIAAVFLTTFGVLLHFFIVGSPIFLSDKPVNFEWSYDADNKIYSIHGDIGLKDTAARIKVYKDKQNNQIKIKVYELVPSLFFSTNKFSAEIPWSGEMDIVWQGKYDQQVIMSSEYMGLFISEFKNGQYQKSMNVFDMDGIDMINRLYNNAPEVSRDNLNTPFDEKRHETYTIISLPSTSGVYTVWTDDDKSLLEETADERIFLYQEDGPYYFYKKGQRLKKVSEKDASKILDYIKQNEAAK